MTEGAVLDMASEGTGTEWARVRVNRELSSRGWNVADLAREALVDAGTIGDFLSGKRWPQIATRSKIAGAVGWTPDSIDLLVQGLDPKLADETVGPQDDDGGVLLDMPREVLEGLSPAERDEVITAAKLSALQTAREIRRRLDER